MPVHVEVACPYCGERTWVQARKFKWPRQPILILCNAEERKGCDKWFTVKAWVVIEHATQLLSGE